MSSAPLPDGAQWAPRYPVPDVVYGQPEDARRWLEAQVWLPLTVGDAIETAAREHPRATALVDDRARLTYAELDDCTAAEATRLLALGLTPGERVLVQVGIGCTAAVSLLSVFRAGLIPVCAVARYRAYEMGALARLSSASAHLVEPGAAGDFDLLRLAEDLRDEQASRRHVVAAGRPSPARATTAALPTPSPWDVAAFQLSGGTTGVPKIIPRFHAEYVGYASAWADRTAIGPDDVLLWCLPVAHNAGMLLFLLPALMRGATLVLLPRFEVEAFLETVEREGVTVTGSIGPIAPRLLDEPHPERFDLSTIRLFVTLNRAGDIERHLGVPSMNIFGITEGLLCASTPGAPDAARHRTVGRPVSPHDEVRVLALGEEREIATGAVGELCFRGPSTLRAYYRDLEATNRAFTSDGFFRTGDLVRKHSIEGCDYLSFEGRAKDNIDRGGEKFGTEDIDALLASHPAVRAACVVGMPDRYLGERVCAFVILRPGSLPPSVEDIGGFLLRRGLAKFKLPERIERVDELPVTSVGKLNRAALRRRIADIVEAESSSR